MFELETDVICIGGFRWERQSGAAGLLGSTGFPSHSNTSADAHTHTHIYGTARTRARLRQRWHTRMHTHASAKFNPHVKGLITI